MPTYNFKQEAQVYVVSGGNRHRIDVTDISFSQTFSEESYSVRTLHAPNNLFEGSVPSKAGGGNTTINGQSRSSIDHQTGKPIGDPCPQ